MPGKKHLETCLSTLEKSAHHEGKKADEKEKDDDENIGHRRREVARDLAFRDRDDVAQRRLLAGLRVSGHNCFFLHRLNHQLFREPVSGKVIVRKTSSSRPSSVCSSSICQCSRAASCPMATASSSRAELFLG